MRQGLHKIEAAGRRGVTVRRPSVPIIHMTEGNILCRCPESLCGKRFSVISLGICNFRCPYCQLGGGLPRSGVRIPLAIDVSLDEIEGFIREQVGKGNPLKISGGEPTVNMELAVHLISYVKAHGGYVCADTSGWSPESTRTLSEIADQIAIDFKAPPRYAEQVTRASVDQAWDNVLASMDVAAASADTLEVRTVFFDFTTADDLILMERHVPSRAYWLIRRFLTDWVPFDKYARSHRPGFDGRAVRYPSWLCSPNVGQMRRVIEDARTKGGWDARRCIVLEESPRDSGGSWLNMTAIPHKRSDRPLGVDD